MKKISAIFVSLFLTACQGFDKTQLTTEESGFAQGLKADPIDRPYCEVDLVDYQLDTRLLAFELVDKINVEFGFNLMTGFAQALGLKIDVERGKMVAAMHLREALNPTASVADVIGTGNSTAVDFQFEIDVKQIHANVGYFRQTPLYKLTAKTIDDTLKALKKEVQSVETDWATRIVYTYNEDQLFVMPVGSVGKVRLGDEFKIFNMEYTWTGTPCQSELAFPRKTTLAPLAILEVIQLEKNAALLAIKQRFSDANILAGARVEIHNLPLIKKEKSRMLDRSIRFTGFRSEPLTVQNGSNIDLTVYVEEQTKAHLSKFGYFHRN